MSDVSDYVQERNEKLCSAVKQLNVNESRYAFVDYITLDERDSINLALESALNSDDDIIKDLMSSNVVKGLHARLKKDLASCFKIDESSLLSGSGRGHMSSHSYQCDNLENVNPTLDEILLEAQMHQDSANSNIFGINAAMAIIGPGTIFAKYNENLYPQSGKISRASITELEQPKENQVAVFLMGPLGAAHGWPFCNYEHRAVAFVSSDGQEVYDLILGSTSEQEILEA